MTRLYTATGDERSPLSWQTVHSALVFAKPTLTTAAAS